MPGSEAGHDERGDGEASLGGGQPSRRYQSGAGPDTAWIAGTKLRSSSTARAARLSTICRHWSGPLIGLQRAVEAGDAAGHRRIGHDELHERIAEAGGEDRRVDALDHIASGSLRLAAKFVCSATCLKFQEYFGLPDTYP
jgi:hypothetical protein